MKKQLFLPLILAIMLFSGSIVRAQLGPYDFHSFLGTYASTSTNATTLVLTGGLDNAYAQTPLPFSFTYNGTAYNSVTVTTNGYIAMGNVTTVLTTGFLSTAPSNNIIAPLGINLVQKAEGSIKVETTGTTPNRIVTIQWEHYRMNDYTAEPTNDINFQLKLYETTNKIEFVYGSFNQITNVANQNVQVGLRGTGVASFINRMTALDWLFTDPGTAVTSTCGLSASCKPASGLTFQFGATGVNQYSKNKATNQSAPILVSESGLNRVIQQIIVNTEGSSLPYSTVSAFAFNTNGTTNPGVDLAAAKLYYTGNTAAFSTTTQFGSTAPNPNGSFFFAAAPMMLNLGNNYFWLVYDVNNTEANKNHYIGAECVSMTVGGEVKTAVTSNPGVLQQIKNQLNGIYTVGNVAGTDYSSLQAAFTDIALYGITGNVYFKIVSDFTVTSPISLSSYKDFSANGAKVMIFPDGADRVISGAIADSGVITIYGADNVIIDGQFYSGGDPRTGTPDGGRHLLVRNDESTGASTAYGIYAMNNTTTTTDGCHDLTIQYCNVMSSQTTGSSNNAIKLYGSAATFSRMKVLNNHLYRCYAGVYVFGTSARKQLDVEVSNNIIGDDNLAQSYSYYGVYCTFVTKCLIKNNLVYNTTLTSTVNYGVCANSCASNVDSVTRITNNIIRNFNGTNTKYGIYTNSSHDIQIDSNTISNLGALEVAGVVYGIYSYVTNYTNPLLNSTVERNKIFNLASNATVYGLLMYKNITAKILFNEIYSLHSAATNAGVVGIMASTVSAGGVYGSIFANNIISNLTCAGGTTGGSDVWGIQMSGGVGHKFYFNTINLSGGFDVTTSSSSGGGISITGNTGNVVNSSEFINNIISNTKVGAVGTKIFGVYNFSDVWAPDNIINYNLYYPTPDVGIGFIGRSGSNPVEYQTLTDWRRFTSQDASSISNDPMFSGTINSIPKFGSSAIGAGVPIPGYNVDFYGTPRSTTNPSIGAFEIPAEVLTYPVDLSVEVENESLTFSWMLIDGAASYHFMLSTKPDFSTTLIDTYFSGNTTTQTIPNLTKYYWKVQALNGSSIPLTYWSPIFTFVTNGPLSVPVLLSPANNSTIQLSNIVAKWSSVFTTQKYHIQVSTQSSFENLLYENTELADTFALLPNVIYPNSTVYWRVRATKPAFTSAWSSIFTLNTNNQWESTESFDNVTFPPDKWSTNILVTSDKWSRQTSGTNPACRPHSGIGMARYYYNPLTSQSCLVSMPIDWSNRGTEALSLSAWFYRDNSGTTSIDDAIAVYVNTTPDLNGTPSLVGTIRRNRNQAPVMDARTPDGWQQYSFPVPLSYNGSNNYIIFKGLTSSTTVYNSFMDDVLIPMRPSSNHYYSSMASQESGEYPKMAMKKKIICAQVTTEGMIVPKIINSLTFNTTGTTSIDDIQNARLYYTGRSNTFSTLTQYGATIAQPNGDMVFNGNQALDPGTHYFWLTYDIAPNATIGNFVDAQFTSITFDGIPRTPSNPAPAGGYMIRPIFTFDLLLSSDISTNLESGKGHFGAETDGSFIYTSISNHNGWFRKFDNSGNYISSINANIPEQPEGQGVKDLAFDGRYFYGGVGDGAAGYPMNKIYKFDLTSANPSMIGEIALPAYIKVKGIAYQPANPEAGLPEGFWVCNTSTTSPYTKDIYLVSMNGTVIATIPAANHGLTAIQGLAYDPWSPGGPFLWCFDQTSNAVPLNQSIVKIGNLMGGGTLTGFAKNVLADVAPAAMNTVGALTAGGLYMYLNPISRVITIGGVLQANTAWPNTLFSYYLMTNLPMSYSETRAKQKDTTDLAAGSTNQRVLDVEILMDGMINPMELTSITFNTNGSTNAANILNAKLYSTLYNPNYNNDLLLGVTQNPSGSFTMTLTGFTLYPGLNYLWLTYDVSPTAACFNILDAEMTSLTIGGVAHTPVVTSGSGNRMILTPLSGSINVGAGQHFKNFNEMFKAIAFVGLSGDLELKAVSDIIEPATALLGQWTESNTGGPYHIKIYPTGTSRTIDCNASNVTMRLEGVDNVTIDGSIDGNGSTRNMTIKNSSTATNSAALELFRKPLALGGGVQNCAVKNCKVSAAYNNTVSYGIRIYKGTDVEDDGQENKDILIQNNAFSNAYYGFYSNGTSSNDKFTGLRVIGNTFGSTNPNTALSYYGLWLQNIVSDINTQTGIYNPSIISNNDLNGFYKSVSGTIYGMYLSACTSLVVHSNTIHNFRHTYTGSSLVVGIGNINSNGTKIYNNAIYDFLNYGSTAISSTIIGIYFSAGEGVTIANNSVHFAGTHTGPESGYKSACFYSYSTDNLNLTLKNNSFSNILSHPLGAEPYAVYATNKNLYAAGSPNNNNYWATNIGYIDATIVTSFSDWKQKTKEDGASFSENPLFESNTNLTPRNVSPLLYSGQIIDYITTDITGFPRTEPIAVGAYEYQGGDQLPSPVIIYPVHEAYGANFAPCNFQWKPVTNASMYDIQYSKDPNFFPEYTVSVNNIVNTNYSVNLDDLTRYYWRVKARNETMSSFWCKTKTFFTNGNLATPLLKNPINQSEINANIDFSWTSSIGANRYHIQISKYPNFTDNIIDKYTKDSSTNCQGLGDQQKFYWRVQADNSVSFSSWSEVRSFRVSGCSVTQTFPTSTNDCAWSTVQSNKGWTQLTSGTNPNCNPHTSPGMVRFNSSLLAAGETALLISSQFDYTLRSGMPATVDFWFYRDSTSSTNYADKMQVFINTTPTDLNGTLLGTFNRDVRNAPVESEIAGHWSHFTVDIPQTYNGAINYIIFKGISDFGYNIFLDDVTITKFFSPSELPMPVLLSPANEATDVPTIPEMRWTLLPYEGNALNYKYQVRIMDNYTFQIVVDTILHNVASFNPVLYPGRTFVWSVRIVDGDDFGPWSAGFEMTTMQICSGGSYFCGDITQHIKNVQFSNISNNNTVCGPVNGYSDYTAQIATVARGMQYTLRIDVENGFRTDRCGAWIDWNQNGIFTDPGEYYPLSSDDDGATYIENIRIPENAIYGYSRMRLRVCDAASNISPCGLTGNR